MTTRYRCDECDAIVNEAEILIAPSPFKNDYLIKGCPYCLDIVDFSQLCNEPGCDELITCVTPTPTGYRCTCSEHVPKTQ